MTTVIENSIHDSIGLIEADTIKKTTFGKDGKARATVVFGGCVSSGQCEEIENSDMWVIESIHPRNEGVSVHLVESE